LDETAEHLDGAESAATVAYGLAAARLELRVAGYCVLCDRIVERRPDGRCGRDPEHPATAISGRIVLGADEPLPALPRFNIAAFLVPPLWGPAHRQWAGAIFLPMWLFMDSVVASAQGRGVGVAVGATVVVCATLAAQVWFAKRANGLAWRRVATTDSVEEYVRRQRVWVVVSIPVFALLMGWGVYYRLVLAA